MKKQIGFLKTTAIGGLLFLLPLMVIGYFVGQLVQLVWAIAVSLQGWIPLTSPGGIALLISAAIGIVLGACFLAGLIARRTMGRRFSGLVEKYLTMFFPRYTIVKAQMSRSIAGEESRTQLKPILAKLVDCTRVAFEVQRCENGTVVVYLPGAPDPWAGSLVYMAADQVQPLDVDFSDALQTFETLGRDSEHLLSAHYEPGPNKLKGGGEQPDSK